MNNLEFVKLNQVCKKITDGSHYSPKGIYNGYPMLSVKDMLHNGFSYADCKYISEEDYNDLLKSDCVPKINDVLIAKDGSYLKHVFTIREEKKQAILSSIGILRPDLKKINPEYLKYYLHSNSVKETVAKKYVSGSALPRIILKNFGEIDVIYKSLIEQQKIAKVLYDLDAKIELNNRINSELEAMAKTLYDYWFVQFDFPDANGKPYRSTGGKMVWNMELKREIPQGWESGVLSDIANITMGQSPPGESYNEDGTGMIFYQGCTDFGNRFPTIRKHTTSPTRFAKQGDILLSVRAPVGTLNISKEDCCIGRGLACLNSKNDAITYLFGVMVNLKQIFDRRNTSGTTFGSITKDDLFSLPVVISNEKTLRAFQNLVFPNFEKQNKIELENIELASLRDWLLPMLMNGQVKVVEAEEMVNERLGMVAEQTEIYEKTEVKLVEKVKKTKTSTIKLNPVDVYKRTLLAAEIVFQLKDTYTLGHLKLQKMLYLCQEIENMALPMNFLKQAMGPYDNQLARSLDKQFETKKWFKYQREASLKYAPLEKCGQHRDDFDKYFENQLEGINYLIKKFTKFTSTQIEAVATLYACWKEAIENNELVNDKLIITKFYNWSKEKEKFQEDNLVKALIWMRNNGIEPNNKRD